MSELTWSFAQIWNRALEVRKERTFTPREKIWASELDGAMIDRYLKMTGTPPTNPPNARSLRKFEAGNIWEAIIGYVLKRAGIHIDSQEWLSYQYEGLLPVTGKLDYIAGGKPDYNKALYIVNTEFSWLPEFITRATREIILHFKNNYPSGLKRIILEIKSCSSYMYELHEKTNTPQVNHKLQLFHYLKAKPMAEGHLIYICKDDARLLEFGVFSPSPIEEVYRKDIQTITNYIHKKEMPPKEKPLLFDPVAGRFTANYRVAYSYYLTMLYGFKNQKEFDDKYRPIVERWNRVLGRIKEGKTMTANNKEALSEMKRAGFDVERLLLNHANSPNSQVQGTNHPNHDTPPTGRKETK